MAATSYTPQGLSRRGRKLILSGVVALAAIGYVVGLRAGVPEGAPGLAEAARSVETSPPTGDVHEAMTYADVGAGRLRAKRPGKTWAEMAAALAAPAGKPVTDEATRAVALAERATRRAYNGAPPTVPHEVTGVNDAACLACHGKGLGIGARVARDLPHPHMTNCTQCHAAQAPPFLRAAGGMLSESTWVGVAAPSGGVRALEGLPPAVPHTLQMRNNCAACHGPRGWPGMQTSHPERSSCLQCHAPVEDLDHPGRALTDAPLLPPLKVAR